MSTIWVELLGSQVRYYGKAYKTRVIEAGAGEPLVLIHGVGGHAEAYSRNVVAAWTKLPCHGHGSAVARAFGQAAFRPSVIPHMPRKSSISWIAWKLKKPTSKENRWEDGSGCGWLCIIADRLGKLILNTTAGIRYEPGVVQRTAGRRQAIIAASVRWKRFKIPTGRPFANGWSG